MSDPTSIADLIGPVLKDLARRSNTDLRRWLDQVHTLRGCAEPVRLTGETMTLDAATGQVLSHYSTANEPHGQLMVRCKNRRATRCPSCADEYRADTYHLIKAGLAGGEKNVPDSIGLHPRVLATLTAPSFGPVHVGPAKNGTTRVCHPRRQGTACWQRHTADDPRLGQPIDPTGYDYEQHVIWNAHAGDLWRRFTTYLRRHLAAAGLSQKSFNERVCVSFAKVAEYQARGVVHYHAVIRLDGRTANPGDWPPPPVWATLPMLEAAIQSAAAAVSLDVPVASLDRVFTLRFGRQVDVQPITAASLTTTCATYATTASLRTPRA